jgi:hypothetical protein
MCQNIDNFSARRCLNAWGLASVPSRATFVKTSVVALVIAVLYRYWLVTPILKYISIGKWFLLAIAAAAASGYLMSLLRFPALALVCASVAGLLLGGTWAAWRVPNDVPISLTGAFESHLESFWRQVLILTVTMAVSGFCCTRFLRDRSSRS